MSNTTTAAVVLNPEDKNVKALVTNIRAAVKGAMLYSAYVADQGVTRETVAPHAAALALLAFPTKNGAAPVQKKDGVRTPYGNAVQAAGAGLRRALPAIESDAESVANLLTTDGLATMRDLLSAETVDTDAILRAVSAEIERRNK